MHILLATQPNGIASQFVETHASGTLYHLPEILYVIEKSFGHECIYITAEESNKIKGVLPLVHMKNRLFGNFLISVPFFNYGGVCAKSPEIEQALLEKAIKIGEERGVSHIEFRHVNKRYNSLPGKSHKVAMVLELPTTSDALWSAFKSKLRSQIRKPEKEGLHAKVGKLELLEDFYHVFSINMRDLGTPVYAKALFGNMLRTFSKNAWIINIYKENTPVAAGFVVGFGENMEIPWASSLREYNRLAGNMMLYWRALQLAIDEGFKKFDFGRSTPNEGTYKFKAQWGAEPVPLHWEYWLANGGELPDISPKNAKYQAAIRAWQKLPVGLTKVIGPSIVKHIP